MARILIGTTIILITAITIMYACAVTKWHDSDINDAANSILQEHLSLYDVDFICISEEDKGNERIYTFVTADETKTEFSVYVHIGYIKTPFGFVIATGQNSVSDNLCELAQ